ncbi:MAG: hypothetical protein ACE5HT_15755 [Gemmatimonadales bacterium]
MPSSISSSNQRLPDVDWGRVWLGALALSVACLGAWEWTLRSHGFVPSVEDDLQAWSVNRDRLDHDGTVLLGSSRAMADLDPQGWARVVGGRVPIQLAITSGAALPMLEHFAEDRSFVGTALVDFVPRIEFDARNLGSRAEGYLLSYDLYRSKPSEYTEANLQYLVPLVAWRSPAVAPEKLLKRIAGRLSNGGNITHFLPEPPYSHLRKDRFRPQDFSKTDANTRFQRQYEFISTQGHPTSQAQTTEILQRIETAVTAIQSRGGRVVIAQLPRCGAIRRVEEERYPKRVYWDRLASNTSALTIDTETIPAVAQLTCPDGSHLDMHDAEEFTRILALAVGRR